mmetsp:Transcript_17054/g.43687  ORF Transcript_17054/g.43687 Transcript_17054/m.43687 type:complete len:461 (+) Transcript_17054:145-1527(+)
MGTSCSAPAPVPLGRIPSTEEDGVKTAHLSDVPLGQAVWESRGCKWATFWTVLYTIATFVCFVHSPVVGSYWCPLMHCRAADHASHAGTHRELNIESKILGGACLFFDVFVIWYHLINPVHPKFRVSRTRKAVIFTHIISGSVQCIMGPLILGLWYAGISPTVVMWLKAALVLWCGLFHVTTASFLALTPFGEVRVMLPAFIFIVGMYCYTLGELLVAPYEKIEVPLLAWWLMTHIYVMNRIVFAVLASFSLLVESRYTLAILLGTALCGPPSLGGAILFFMLTSLVVFNVAFVNTMEDAYAVHEGDKGLHFISSGGSYVAARVKQQFVSAEGAVYTSELKALQKAKGKLGKQDVARVIFSKLDRDGTGKLELAEIGRLLVLWGLPSYEAKKVLIERDTNGDGVIDLQEFTDNFEDVWEFAATIVLGQVEGINDNMKGLAQELADDARAKLVHASKSDMH